MGKNDLNKGIVLGIGLAVIIPAAATVMIPALRPVARSLLKTGMLALEKGREATAEFGEMVEDLYAEVQDELRESHLDTEAEAPPPEKPKVAVVKPVSPKKKKA
jgi:hypothetical protein